jgi:hypothetical protein
MPGGKADSYSSPPWVVNGSAHIHQISHPEAEKLGRAECRSQLYQDCYRAFLRNRYATASVKVCVFSIIKCKFTSDGIFLDYKFFTSLMRIALQRRFENPSKQQRKPVLNEETNTHYGA